eukprot:TRINITY_DN4590_c0_g1_i1.p2 TRINITY_DN4590_c0_g1~~TRINITY_DN4590_c0_g1_i1.p2  ORF type:complete len:118 (-),score=9.71 TRINITY_DN4590_c0_g1_i1:436-762(-)
MIRRPPRSTPLYSSAASDVYKRQIDHRRESKHRSKAKKKLGSKNMYMRLLVKVSYSLTVAVQVPCAQGRDFFPQGSASKTHAVQGAKAAHVSLSPRSTCQGQVLTSSK